MKDLVLHLLGVLLTAIILVLALHVLVVLFTGGYTFAAYGLKIRAREVDLPLILLLVAVILYFPLRHRTFSWHVFFSHEAAILFSVLLMLYLANGKTLASGDTAPARYLPLSILREGDFDLDEFPFLYERGTPYYLRFVNGHYVSDYPVGPALLALPFYLPSALGSVGSDSRFLADLEKLSAAAIVALSGVVLYLVLRRLTSLRMALFITAVYGLGTSSLSTSSQALWQHGPSQFALTVTLYCLVRGYSQSPWAAVAGFPMALAVISRPSDLMIALPLGAYVLLHHRRHVWGFLLSAVPPVLFQLWYNTTYFDNPFRTQWPLLESRLWTTPFWEGLTGILLSPGRGLFVYSPIFLLSVLGAGLAWRRNRDPLLRYLCVGAVLSILLYSKWLSWWGGWTYGPRLLADLSPILALFLYPLKDFLLRSQVLKGVFVVLAVCSIGAHSIGAFWDRAYWNAHPNVDQFPQRLWSWSDNQLMNPPKELVNRAVIALRGLPTSRAAPELLSVSYRTNLPPTVTIKECKPIQVLVKATNEGRAVWLARAKRKKGRVQLAWRWRRAEQEHPAIAGQVPLRYDVFPQQSYEFQASIEPPQEPGTYLLEVGLVSERVTRFSARGSPPVRSTVKVDSAPTLPEKADAVPTLLEELRAHADDPPRLALSTNQPQYLVSNILHLSLTLSIGERSWVVDAYLLLQGPDGALWFYDGRELIPRGKCVWTPLAKGVELRKGSRGSAPLFSFPLAGMRPGTYLWYLLLTEADSYRIVAEARTSFEVTP